MPLDDATLQTLARYLDGALVGPELARFERRLAQDPDLRAEAERHKRIAGAIKQIYVAPAYPAKRVLAVAQAGASRPVGDLQPRRMPDPPPPASRLPPLLRYSAIAASLLAGVAGVWMVWQQFKPDPTASMIVGPPPVKTAAAYYNTELARGFEPDWVCADDKEFADTFQQRLGQAMVLKEMPAGTKMLGLDYAPVLTPLTIGLLAKVDDQSVLVLIDRLSADNPAHINTDCANLQVHRREVGSLVLYEITPLPQARVLDFLQQASSDAAPTDG